MSKLITDSILRAKFWGGGGGENDAVPRYADYRQKSNAKKPNREREGITLFPNDFVVAMPTVSRTQPMRTSSQHSALTQGHGWN